MSLRTKLLKVSNKIRSLPSKASWGIRTTTVTIRTRTHVGGRVGKEGGTNDSDLLLVPSPPTRDASQREIRGSGGMYEAGDVRVGPITPAFAGGGYTEAQLAPTSPGNGVEILYVLSGGLTAEYMLVDIQTDKSLSYFLTLRKKRSTP